tara:strand:+ start:545 stop:865 length:321 start_codon:yes stop_codon:yes gene_type:complete
MAGSNRVSKHKKEMRTFTIQIEVDTLEKLRKLGDSQGNSIGYLVRQVANDIVVGNTYDSAVSRLLYQIKTSPLIKGDDLPDGQKYSEYVGDRIENLFITQSVKRNK